MRPLIWTNREETRSGSIFSSLAALLAACPPWFRLPCCIPRRRMRPTRLPICIKRHYPISWIEMGEEADGQHMLPEDYGALYLQFATAIHRLVPEANLGGPPFEGTFDDGVVWAGAG